MFPVGEKKRFSGFMSILSGILRHYRFDKISTTVYTVVEILSNL